MPIRAVRPIDTQTLLPVRARILTDTVDILGDAAMTDTGKVEVDDMHHILDVETTGRNTGSHHDGALGGPERAPKVVRQTHSNEGNTNKASSRSR